MRHRDWFLLTLYLLIAGPIVGVAAESPAPWVILDTGGTSTGPPSLEAPSATCLLGEMRPPGVASAGASPPWKAYELLRPSTCTACPLADGLVLRNVIVRGRFRDLCSVPVTISIVEVGGAPGCPAPDTTRLVCPPTTFTITATSATAQVDYVVPLASPCCITRDVFVCVSVDGNGDCPRDPAFYIATTSSPCLPCESYIQAVTIPSPDDMCARGVFNWKITAEADCCAPTPAGNRSWGRIRTLYR
jgi:hypothetical protein